MRPATKAEPVDSFVQVPETWRTFMKTRPGEVTVLLMIELLDLDFKDKRQGRNLDVKKSAWIKAEGRATIWKALNKLADAGLISIERGPKVRVLAR